MNRGTAKQTNKPHRSAIQGRRSYSGARRIHTMELMETKGSVFFHVIGFMPGRGRLLEDSRSAPARAARRSNPHGNQECEEVVASVEMRRSSVLRQKRRPGAALNSAARGGGAVVEKRRSGILRTEAAPGRGAQQRGAGRGCSRREEALWHSANEGRRKECNSRKLG